MKIQMWMLVLTFVVVLTGCSTMKPVSEERRQELMMDWNLPMENPWFPHNSFEH